MDGAAKSPGSWRCNEIKLVVASHPNKLQAFNAPCALSPNFLYANSFRLCRPAIPSLDGVRTKSGFYSDSVGFFIFQDFWRSSRNAICLQNSGKIKALI